MIGQIITDPKTGEPLDNSGNKLSVSSYNPPEEVKKLFAKVQRDYQVAYVLQHRPFDEFDGYSLLQRTKLDQQVFGAFVGAEFVPQNKRWRWKGRKNTSRNKLIGILAHMLSGILYPMVYAKNDKNEEDKMTARVMKILVEEKLKKARYDIKFLYMVLSALVNPAVFCGVEYVEAIQKVKQKLKDGKAKIVEVVDELLSGLALNVIPIDEIMLPDFYSGTGSIQNLPVILRVRRIPWDLAQSIYKGKYSYEGKDLFDFVQAGKTRIVLTGQENQTLYDIDWTEADRDYVQEITAYYRSEDLQVTWVGGVGMFNYDDCYNTNPFEHRRMTLVKDRWMTIPVYPFAMSGYEPLDPTGRFAYYKSGAFKEYWDDQSLNEMHKIWHDGTKLDVFKPIFLSGVSKIDSTVMVPSAVVPMPMNAKMEAYSLSPNLAAAFNVMKQQEQDMSESTQDKIMTGITDPNVTATATAQAIKNAKVSLGLFGVMTADLIRQVGELTIDCIIQHETVGEIDTSVPESLRMKYKTFLSKGKDKGKDITNRVIFTDRHMGKKYGKDKLNQLEWDLYHKAGGAGSDQRIYEVNPYQFARYTYSMSVDADQIVTKSIGADRNEKVLAFNMLTDPRVAPFTDQKAVVDDFAIEEFGGTDPDRYKAKGNPGDMLSAIMGQGSPPVQIKGNGAGVVAPLVTTQVNA